MQDKHTSTELIKQIINIIVCFNFRSECLENIYVVVIITLFYLIASVFYMVFLLRWKQKLCKNQSQSTNPLLNFQKFEKSEEKISSTKPSTSKF